MKTQKFGTLFIRYLCSERETEGKNHAEFRHASKEEMFFMAAILLAKIHQARILFPYSFGTASDSDAETHLQAVPNRGSP